MCCHSAIVTMDHLGEIVSRNGKGSLWEGLRMHRTKCSQIIKNVIARALEEEVAQELKNKKFAVFIDESTDISTAKHLCICVRYFSELENNIIYDYLGLIPVVSTTGEDLFLALEEKLESVGISFSNCIVYSSDGAANVIGAHNSVWSRVKAETQHCVQLKCICHSLNLVVQHAFEAMPSSIGFLLTEIPSFFSKSQIRREDFLSLFERMDLNSDRQGTPTPFQKYSVTRWLVRGNVLYNLLVNWQELKVYFSQMELKAPASARYKVSSISNMLKDDSVYLLIVFLTPIVREFEQINALFQSASVDPEKLVRELSLHHKSVKDRVFDVRGYQKPLARVDFRAKFSFECGAFIQNQSCGTKEGAEKIVETVQGRCLKFLLELISQMESRLPENTEIFRGLSYLSPSRVLSQVDKVNFGELPLRHLMGTNAQLIEDQYRKVSLIIWTDTDLFKNSTISKDAVKFWASVRSYQNVLGSFAFRELADYCLACLSLPISNAFVERVFSQVTYVKSKRRNRMQIKMLDSVVRVKSYLSSRGLCCKEYTVSAGMVQQFTSKMYGENIDGETEDQDLSILLHFD